MTQCEKNRPQKKKFLPIAREGLTMIGASAFVTVYVAAMGCQTGGLFFLLVTSFLIYFFRDPEREAPREAGGVISPADGKVIFVGLLQDGEFTGREMLKISIFMNVFNVHVNRSPVDAAITKITYVPGKFFSANLDKASKDNERNALFLRTADGREVVVVQIAGLIARRIVCTRHEGEELRQGERFGIIRFGSRVDVYLPPDTKPSVTAGDKVLAGTSILGHLT